MRKTELHLDSLPHRSLHWGNLRHPFNEAEFKTHDPGASKCPLVRPAPDPHQPVARPPRPAQRHPVPVPANTDPGHQRPSVQAFISLLCSCLPSARHSAFDPHSPPPLLPAACYHHLHSPQDGFQVTCSTWDGSYTSSYTQVENMNHLCQLCLSVAYTFP